MKNSSGLPVHLNRLVELEYRDITSNEIIAIYNEKATLSMEPGTGYSYSNLNYQLASIVLEKVTGLSFQQYLEKYTFKPIGMKHSGVERTHDYPTDKAKGYTIVGDSIRREKKKTTWLMQKGGGNLYSTVVDLYKWDQALYESNYVTERSKQLLFNGKPSEYGGYGYGFKIKPYRRNSTNMLEGKLVRHGGSMYGYISNVHRYLEDQITIIILGNLRPFPIMEITIAIENIVLGTKS